MWQDIAASIGTSTVITGAFVLFINKWIESRFEMKLEAYKDKLKAESDIKILQLTKALELKASERNIRLTGIFEKQAETILTIYKQLHSVQECAHRFIAKMHSAITSPYDKNTADNAFKEGYELVDVLRQLMNFWAENKLLLTPANNKLLREIMYLYADKACTFILQVKQWSETPNAVFPKAPKELAELQEKIPTIQKALEAQFRNILGIQISEILGKSEEQ